MADNDNDLFEGSDDELDRDLDQEIEEDEADEIDEIFDGDEDEDEDEEPELDEYGDPIQREDVSLAGAGLSHTISDEAGTRLDLTDIHGGALKPIEMSQEMKTSFLEYSMSVIVARALPDVRDGLKPVHRRILYAMNEAHIVPSRPHKSWVSTTRMEMRPSTTPWFVWRRTSPCACPWWTATATSAPSTATPRQPCVTPRAA